MRLTWVRAVAGLMCRQSPISWLERPAATSVRTSRSLGVRTSSRSGSACTRLAAAASVTRCATAGERRASPEATARTASRRASGGVSLRRKPLAPRRMAAKTWSSVSKVVRTIPVSPSPASPTTVMSSAWSSRAWVCALRRRCPPGVRLGPGHRGVRRRHHRPPRPCARHHGSPRRPEPVDPPIAGPDPARRPHRELLSERPLARSPGSA